MLLLGFGFIEEGEKGETRGEPWEFNLGLVLLSGVFFSW